MCLYIFTLSTLVGVKQTNIYLQVYVRVCVCVCSATPMSYFKRQLTLNQMRRLHSLISCEMLATKSSTCHTAVRTKTSDQSGATLNEPLSSYRYYAFYVHIYTDMCTCVQINKYLYESDNCVAASALALSYCRVGHSACANS